MIADCRSPSLTFSLINPNPDISLTGIGFSDTLPAGFVVASTNPLTGACGGGTITATPGSSSVTLTSATLGFASTNDSCSFSVNLTVTSNATAGLASNSVTPTSNEGGSGATSTASIDVLWPPFVSPSIGVSPVPVTGSTSLTFTISNLNGSTALTGVGTADTLSAGLIVSTPNGLTNSCSGGVITANPGSNSVSLSGASIPALGSCSFSVNVTAIGGGTQTITYSATSTNGGNNATGTYPVQVTTVTGDANGDSQVTASDVLYLIKYLFAGGPSPVGSADVNGDGQVNASDIFYLIDYLFAGGPAPK